MYFFITIFVIIVSNTIRVPQHSEVFDILGQPLHTFQCIENIPGIFI